MAENCPRCAGSLEPMILFSDKPCQHYCPRCSYTTPPPGQNTYRYEPHKVVFVDPVDPDKLIEKSQKLLTKHLSVFPPAALTTVGDLQMQCFKNSQPTKAPLDSAVIMAEALATQRVVRKQEVNKQAESNKILHDVKDLTKMAQAHLEEDKKQQSWKDSFNKRR